MKPRWLRARVILLANMAQRTDPALHQINILNTKFFDVAFLNNPGAFIRFRSSEARGKKVMIVESDLRHHIKDEFWIHTGQQHVISPQTDELMKSAKSSLFERWGVEKPKSIVFVELGIRNTEDRER